MKGGVRNSSEAFGFLALATLGSANKWVCGSLRSPKCSATPHTSHTRHTLSEMPEPAIEGGRKNE